MLARLHVIIDSEEEKDYLEVVETLNKLYSGFSISPYRPYVGKAKSSEFFVTADMSKEEADLLIPQLNNDFDGEDYDLEAYGFNTKMFHPLVYYINFILMI